MYQPDISYDPALRQLSLRSDLLAGTQTDVQPDHGIAVQYGAAAYAVATGPETAGTDITAAGEALGKLALRMQQSGEFPEHEVDAALDESRNLLPPDEPETIRERMATELLAGRVATLRLLDDPKRADMLAYARQSYLNADSLYRSLHVPGSTHDRYATMLSKHSATTEVLCGNAAGAAAMATRGAWEALRARREASSLSDHSKFVRSQVIGNVVVAGLAVSIVMSRLPQVAAWRQAQRARIEKRLQGR